MLYLIGKIECFNKKGDGKCYNINNIVCTEDCSDIHNYLFYNTDVHRRVPTLFQCYPDTKREYKKISKDKLLLLASREKNEILKAVLKKALKEIL